MTRGEGPWLKAQWDQLLVNQGQRQAPAKASTLAETEGSRLDATCFLWLIVDPSHLILGKRREGLTLSQDPQPLPSHEGNHTKTHVLKAGWQDWRPEIQVPNVLHTSQPS